MFKRKLYIAVISVLLVSLLAGCAVKPPIKLGYSGCLTGRNSGIGVSGRDGAQLAVDEINASGGIKGRKIELVVVDDKNMPDEGIKVDQELINQKVAAIIGHMSSGPTIASLPNTEKQGILMVSPTTSSESLTGKDDLFVRVISSNKYQGILLAKAAIEVKHSKKAAILYELNNRPYTEEVSNYFKSTYESAGGQITTIENFQSTNNIDYVGISQKIAATGADGVLISASGMDAAIFSQHFKKLNPEIQIYTGMWAMTKDFIQNGGSSVEGVYLAGVYDKDNKNEAFIKFRNEYIKRYKDEPTFAAVYAYEAVKMVAKCMESYIKFDTQGIKKSLLTIGKFQGLQGDFVLDSYGDTDRSYFLITVDKGVFKKVD